MVRIAIVRNEVQRRRPRSRRNARCPRAEVREKRIDVVIEAPALGAGIEREVEAGLLRLGRPWASRVEPPPPGRSNEESALMIAPTADGDPAQSSGALGSRTLPVPRPGRPAGGVRVGVVEELGGVVGGAALVSPNSVRITGSVVVERPTSCPRTSAPRRQRCRGGSRRRCCGRDPVGGHPRRSYAQSSPPMITRLSPVGPHGVVELLHAHRLVTVAVAPPERQTSQLDVVRLVVELEHHATVALVRVATSRPERDRVGVGHLLLTASSAGSRRARPVGPVQVEDHVHPRRLGPRRRPVDQGA